MRLLETETLKLEEFFEINLPRYAILSHRWETEEITFQDMAIPSNRSEAQGKYGFAKVRGACMLALSRGYKYIWIDTCCIDKTSSAELTEAINSMYNWYKNADICFAFLSDTWEGRHLTMSYWFDRGWTLQELIAPRELEFYDAKWKSLGTKEEHSMSIAGVTGIDIGVLLGNNPREISVARRMYWAAERKTTRVEDEAYCLMGLFNVNMPLIYGEGRKAFRRLQEEIIRMNDDQSIFAWYFGAGPTWSSGFRRGIDILASSPKAFAYSFAISPQQFRRIGRKPMTITNQGISLELALRPFGDVNGTHNDGENNRYIEVEAILDCQMGSVPATFPTIRLRKVVQQQEVAESPYYRIITEGTTEWTQHASLRDLDVLGDSPVLGLDPMEPHQDTLDDSNRLWQKKQITITYESFSESEGTRIDFWIVSLQARGFASEISQVYPPECWDRISRQFRIASVFERYFTVEGALSIRLTGPFPQELSQISLRSNVVLVIGRRMEVWPRSPSPWCRLINYRETRELKHIYNDYYASATSGDNRLVNSEYERADHLLDLGHGHGLKASIKMKKVSGIMYYVVCLEPQVPGLEKNELSLMRGDRGYLRLRSFFFDGPS